ncbi:hypothetical protein DEU56DRAFT_479016 [Suillus clintonianus]|uniref:uncharacterized protein n=1 Tax=Suillus clintonianus TaxID=1904413 RepID=UPI001B877686|nr:uncharacterized protein DEU56DRAFT_479016 [Suillus clintonianus]KAG2153317.1 hypothetical protein DEU56DRAFT_479016 [Suillus clintonianus]
MYHRLQLLGTISCLSLTAINIRGDKWHNTHAVQVYFDIDCGRSCGRCCSSDTLTSIVAGPVADAILQMFSIAQQNRHAKILWLCYNAAPAKVQRHHRTSF